jgi:hypothetical protein
MVKKSCLPEDYPQFGVLPKETVMQKAGKLTVGIKFFQRQALDSYMFRKQGDNCA